MDDGGTANGGSDTSETQTFTIAVDPDASVAFAAADSATADESQTPPAVTVELSVSGGRSLVSGVRVDASDALVHRREHRARRGSLSHPGRPLTSL